MSIKELPRFSVGDTVTPKKDYLDVLIVGIEYEIETMEYICCHWLISLKGINSAFFIGLVCKDCGRHIYFGSGPAFFADCMFEHIAPQEEMYELSTFFSKN